MKTWQLLARAETRKARAVFKNSPGSPGWLSSDKLYEISPLAGGKPLIAADPDILMRSGREKADYLLKLVTSEKIIKYLELGCWDGMVCCELQNRGKSTTAIDNRAAGFDERAQIAGVVFIEADASYLSFEDETFDFVFSFASFEHFHEPESVFKEAIRVVKPGGYIYLTIGPLYMSPWGLHVEKKIRLPYVQLLFQPEVLQCFADKNKLGTIDFCNVNGWSVDNYRLLWEKYSNQLKTIMYYEIPNVSHLEYIIKHAPCFKSKTENFDNLVVESIEILLRKL
ncbi:class I SAM-dependent methyltransferase [Chloroflexota bacterium]